MDMNELEQFKQDARELRFYISENDNKADMILENITHPSDVVFLGAYCISYLMQCTQKKDGAKMGLEAIIEQMIQCMQKYMHPASAYFADDGQTYEH